jgi:HlyD family secretion protein
MQASNAPLPGQGGAAQPAPAKEVPAPSLVPPKPEPQKPRTALWGILAAVVVVAGGVGLYMNRSQTKPSEGGPGVVVPTMILAAGDVHETIRVSGTVAAQNFAALLAPRIMGSRSNMNRGGDFGGRGSGGAAMMAMAQSMNSGGGGGGQMGGGGGPMGDFSLILMHLANPGIHVKSGETVAEFDPQMQAQRLDDYKDTLDQQENTVKKQLAMLAASREAHDQSVRTAKATWETALLDLKTTPIKSQIDAEKIKLSVEEAESTHKQLVYEASLVDESQRAAIRSQQLDREQSRIELQRAEMNVQRMTIKAPMDGIVVMQSVIRNGVFGQFREGDQVAAGQPFMSIVDPTSMVLNATVNQVDAERLRLGMKTTVRLDAYPEVELPGTLIGIGAMSKSSTFRAGYVGEIPVRIKIEKGDSRLIPDLSGSAEIVLNSENTTLVAPRSAVFEENGASYVFVQGPEGWIRKQVQLGLMSYTEVAIRSGVTKGDKIALQRPM